MTEDAQEEAQGGRIFFSTTGRTFGEEDEICVLSVGVDIGSSTSHLVFSRIVLERLDSRYVVTERETFYQSDILLTPYSAEDTIDADALGAFIEKQYEDAKVDPDEIDTGALILTGVAVRRSNARRIGELFAAQAGKLVAVCAGDSLETVMAAYGSGAVARSIRDGAPVMNVDVGGGTSKIAVCADGKVIDVTALDVGARLVCSTMRPHHPARGGRPALRRGAWLEARDRRDARRTAGAALAARMADSLFEAMKGGSPRAGGADLLRLDPLTWRGDIVRREFFRRRLGIHLWRRDQRVRRSRPAARRRNPRASARLGAAAGAARRGIRATVIGASQYTMQVTGSTIFVSPLDALPLRNVPVIAPTLPLDDETHRSRRGRRGDQRGAEAARSRRRRKRRSRSSCRGAARRPSTASTISAAASPTAWKRCWPTAIPSCWPATATSAA